MSAALFTIAAVMYAGAAATIGISMRRRASVIAGRAAWMLGATALGAHAAAIITRGVEAGRLPVQNQYESMTGVALFAAVGGLVVARRIGRSPAIIAGFVAAAALLIAAHHLSVPGRKIEPEAPILSTATLLKFHVTSVIAGYGISAVGGILGLAWLLVPRVRTGAMVGLMASAARLTFWVLGVGILLGAWWAHRAWGRWWAFDPKETWALLTWLVYFVPVHAAAVRGRAAATIVAWFLAGGMLVMLWSYFGVNLLLVSLHAYA